MAQFRDDNTEGFSGDDLDTLNEAMEIVLRAVGDNVAASSCADAVSNAWIEGIDAEELAARAIRALV